MAVAAASTAKVLIFGLKSGFGPGFSSQPIPSNFMKIRAAFAAKLRKSLASHQTALSALSVSVIKRAEEQEHRRGRG